MKDIQVELAKELKKLGITPHKFARTADLRHATIYALVNNEAERIHFDTLRRVLETLNELYKEKGYEGEVTVGDIIKYK